MSAIHTLNGRNVSGACIPSLKSIIGDKPVTAQDVYTHNALAAVLSGAADSKDIGRVLKALNVAGLALLTHVDLAENGAWIEGEAAEDFCRDAARAISLPQALDALAVLGFLTKFFEVKEG